MPAILNLTPAAAQQRLQTDGLSALGLTTLALSPHWATSPLGAYSDTDLTLGQPAGVLRAPFRGLLQGTFAPATSTLNGDLSASDTNVVLIPGGGSAFPSPSGGDAVLLTLSSIGGGQQEIVACTARVGDTLTVERGFNGTAKQAFTAGDAVSLRLGRGRSSVQFSGANGEPLKMPCAAFRLHPQAILRLEQLMSVRYGAPNRPVPWSLVIRNVEHYKTDQLYEADDNLPVNGALSFHDGRGLIVDPIYVASVFEDLLGWLQALQPASVTGNVNDANGGIHAVSQLSNVTLIHVVDPHGGRFQKAADQVQLVKADSGGTPKGAIPDSGLVTLDTGDRIQADAGDNGRMRWGWATDGLLKRDPLTPPGPANGTLHRQFFRVCAVDVEWYLRGNRTGGPVLTIPKDDGWIPPELLPEVRDQVNIDYLADGPDTLAEATRMLQLQNRQIGLVVSPILDTTLLTPNNPQLGNAHWPNYPAPGQVGLNPTPNTIPPNGIDAGFVSADSHVSNDVVVTLKGWVQSESHVRIYPRQFQEILAIGEEPSLLRGDGGATIATGGLAAVLLPNPFNLDPGGLRPDPNKPKLTIDIVITDRMGVRKMFGAVNVKVADSDPRPAVPTTPFSGAGGMGTLVAWQLQSTDEGLGPSPLFGIPMPAPPPPGNPPATFLDLILSLAAEPSPRQAPRLPMMARLETMVVTGTTGPNAQPAGSLLWEAVVSGARWAGESLSAQHNLGNPGNPAGPDVHAPGVHVTGALAYDVALVALHRTQPLYPWPNKGGTTPGWVVFTGGNNFNVPSDAANTANTGTGVLLRTIATACETSQLADQTPPPKDETLGQMVTDAANALKLPAPSLSIPVANETRLQKEIRREFFVSKYGLRDVQWSLLRAVSQARELIYIESPQLSRTARPGNPAQVYEVDLIAAIVARLQAYPRLKLIVCTPRLSDFGNSYRTYARQHYKARHEAAGMLLSAAPDRVVIFHPVGFPGRTAFIRTTSVVVDDVWCLVGASHLRRRGMTFDGSVAVASFDRQMEEGYSKKVRDFRRRLMAAKLRVPAPQPNQPLSGDWVRLARPESAFAAVADLLAEGGLGRIQPLWPGPKDTQIIAEDDKAADPDGSNSDQFWQIFSGALHELGT